MTYGRFRADLHNPHSVIEGPSTLHLRALDPKASEGMILGPGTSNLSYLDPLGKLNLGATGFSEGLRPFT